MECNLSCMLGCEEPEAQTDPQLQVWPCSLERGRAEVSDYGLSVSH